ncbi:hypothetical protein EON65_07260 [archaeon]|nr:MAG: hypothetical protein EON65_07260 [archaeon]
MSGPSPSASLESLGKMSLDSNSQQAGAAIPKAANFLSQLEVMMGAVKKEASALEGMKTKLKEMEEIKIRYQDLKNKSNEAEIENFELKRKVKELEQTNAETRSDMQRLNDLYTSDHRKYTDLQLQHNKLQQDLQSISSEKDFLAKELTRIPEMKTSIKALKHQLHTAKMSHEEEKHSWVQKVTETEKKYGQHAEHINNLVEEINGYKLQLRERQEQIDRLSAVYIEMKQEELVVDDRSTMVMEDLVAQGIKSTEAIRALQAAAAQHTMEQQNAAYKIKKREEKYAQLKEKATQMEAAYSEKLSSMQQAFTAMQEQGKEVSNKNTAMAQENASLKSKLYQKMQEEEQLQNEVSKLRSTVLESEAKASTKELEMLSQIRSISSQRDDMAYQLQSLQGQYNQLKDMAKGEGDKHRTELMQVKEHEHVLSEEIEKLHRELEEKMVVIHMLETEKLTQESTVKQELSGNSHIINTLKLELEKRLAELMAMREERDVLSLQHDRLAGSIDELRANLAKQEHMYKQMLENERKTMTKELSMRNSRIQQLEKEKEELLNETQSLCTQISDLQKQVGAQHKQVEDKQRELSNFQSLQSNQEKSISAYVQDVEKLKAEKQELLQAVKIKEQLLQQEKAQKDIEIKEVRKMSSQTLIDINEQMKNIYDENNSLKKSYYELVEKEKRLSYDYDKLVSEYDDYQRKYTHMLQEAQRENVSLKASIQEYTQKHSFYADHKSKLESDLLMLTRQADRLAEEKQSFQDTVYALEQKAMGLSEQLQASNHSVQSLQQNIFVLNNKINEYESIIGSKNQAIESLSAELSSLENHGLIEIKKYKINMTHLEHEHSELQSTHQYLQKEYDEHKQLLQRTISKHNEATQSLLEELSIVKEGLQREKKSRSMEVETLNSKYQALEMNLMKTKQEYEDILNRKNLDMNESGYKFIYLEQENIKLKSQLQEKDSSLAELEQQIYAQKKVAIELKEQLTLLGNENSQIKSALEIEIQNKKRLESKVKVLLEQQTNSIENMSIYSGNTNMPSARIKSARTYANGSAVESNQSMYSATSNTLPYGQIYPAGNNTTGAAHVDDNVSVLSMNTGVKSMYSHHTTSGQPAFNVASDSLATGSANGAVPSTPMRTQSFHQQQASIPVVPTLPMGSTQPAGSPAVDRVSAALALKLAHQQRNQPAQSSQINSVAGQAMAATAAAFEASDIGGSIGRFSRPSTASNTYAATSVPNMQANSSYDPYYDDINIDPPSNPYPSTTFSLPHTHSSYDVDQKDYEKVEQNSLIEESIRRTQEKLNRKLGSHVPPAPSHSSMDNVMTSPSGMTVNTYHSNNSAHSNQSNASGTSRNAGKLLDTIQHAHSLYPASPAKEMQGGGGGRPAVNDVDISVPSLRPASPPRDKTIATDDNLNMYRGDDQEDDVLIDQDGDEDEPANVEDALNRDLLRFQYPNTSSGKIPNKPMSAKGKKMKKKKKASASAVDLHGDLQLPRINNSRSSQVLPK